MWLAVKNRSAPWWLELTNAHETPSLHAHEVYIWCYSFFSDVGFWGACVQIRSNSTRANEILSKKDLLVCFKECHYCSSCNRYQNAVWCNWRKRGLRLEGDWGCQGQDSWTERVTSLIDGVKSAPLMPLHVSDAPNWLDLRNLGSKLGAVLILPLFKQVLVASVSRILIAHPAGATGTQKGEADVRGEMMVTKYMQQLFQIMQHLLGGGTHVPLWTRTEETFSW